MKFTRSVRLSIPLRPPLLRRTLRSVNTLEVFSLKDGPKVQMLEPTRRPTASGP